MENKLLILEAFTFTLESLKYAEAERNYQESRSAKGALDGDGITATEVDVDLNKTPTDEGGGVGVITAESTTTNLSLAEQVARARDHIQASLQYKSPSIPNYLSSGGVIEDPEMREENAILKKKVENLENQVKQLTDRVTKLEHTCSTKPTHDEVAAFVPVPVPISVPSKAAGDTKKHVEEDDDDVDLFGSEEEDEASAAAAKELKEKRLAEYAAKKSKKPAVVAKSNVILDVKPWDDETDMKKLEEAVRSIVMDGLLWGSSKLVAVGYGINKLQISTVVEDEKVSVDELQEKIESFEDFVQSVDIAAFNKI